MITFSLEKSSLASNMNFNKISLTKSGKKVIKQLSPILVPTVIPSTETLPTLEQQNSSNNNIDNKIINNNKINNNDDDGDGGGDDEKVDDNNG